MSRSMLWRHIGRRADYFHAALMPLWIKFGHQSKVEDNYPAFSCHQHIRRFDISMKLTCLMESIEPLGQLLQSNPQTVIIWFWCRRDRIQRDREGVALYFFSVTTYQFCLLVDLNIQCGLGFQGR